MVFQPSSKVYGYTEHPIVKDGDKVVCEYQLKHAYQLYVHFIQDLSVGNADQYVHLVQDFCLDTGIRRQLNAFKSMFVMLMAM